MLEGCSRPKHAIQDDVGNKKIYFPNEAHEDIEPRQNCRAALLSAKAGWGTWVRGDSHVGQSFCQCLQGLGDLVIVKIK